MGDPQSRKAGLYCSEEQRNRNFHSGLAREPRELSWKVWTPEESPLNPHRGEGKNQRHEVVFWSLYVTPNTKIKFLEIHLYLINTAAATTTMAKNPFRTPGIHWCQLEFSELPACWPHLDRVKSPQPAQSPKLNSRVLTQDEEKSLSTLSELWGEEPWRLENTPTPSMLLLSACFEPRWTVCLRCSHCKNYWSPKVKGGRN